MRAIDLVSLSQFTETPKFSPINLRGIKVRLFRMTGGESKGTTFPGIPSSRILSFSGYP